MESAKRRRDAKKSHTISGFLAIQLKGSAGTGINNSPQTVNVLVHTSGKQGDEEGGIKETT